MTKTGFITMEKYEGKESVGSSRIRAKWVAKYWDEAEIHNQAEEYDAVVYQKSYWIEHAKRFDGIQIADYCDPDWFEWGKRVKQTMVHCDAVTTSTEELANAVENIASDDTIVRHIPDRMDPEWHQEHKEHHDGRAETVVWYGYSQNFPMLRPALKYIDELDLNLIVIADKAFMLPPQYSDSIDIINYKWSEETVNRDIVKGDIVLNPQSSRGKWKYKSNNKTTSANFLNMPVAHTLKELKNLMDPETRKEEAKKQREWAEENYHIDLSVEDYKELIEDIKAQ